MAFEMFREVLLDRYFIYENMVDFQTLRSLTCL
jgi:hypothetical protein